MASLTDEQRRKIEENRKRALEKRQGKNQPPAPSSNSYTKPAQPSSNYSKPFTASAPVSSFQNKPTPQGNVNNNVVKPVQTVSAGFIQTPNTGQGIIPNFNSGQNTRPNFSPNKIARPSLNTVQGVRNNLNTGQNVRPNFTSGQGVRPTSVTNQYVKPPSSSATNVRPNLHSNIGPPSAVGPSNIPSNVPQQKSSTFFPIKSGFDKPKPTNTTQGPNSFVQNNNQVTAKVLSGLPPNTPVTNKLMVVKGKCVLTSRRTFKVDVGYCGPLIDLVFKSMKSKQYDAQTKTWSFGLDEYNSFMRQIQAVSEAVSIEPLPQCVRTVFMKQICGDKSEKHVPSVDLSNVSEKLVSSLLPFQKDGVDFAIWRNGRVLIADDMGLGKTLQALCVACYYRNEWPLLVVVPSSVRFAWKEQVLRWVDDLCEDDVNVPVTSKDITSFSKVNVLSYDLMVKTAKQIAAKQFKIIIMDESHLMKNMKTARNQAAMPLLRSARRSILLSGTPALSRPCELFSQISAVDPRIFPKFHEFGLRYCDGKQNNFGWDFSGSSNLAELQLVLEERIMIRRLKKDVLRQLPSKCRQMVILDHSSVKVTKTMKVSHKLVDKAKGSDRRGALLQYFSETAMAKSKAVREYVLDLLESDKKLLVFAHHQTMLDALEDAVKGKLDFIRIDGNSNAQQKDFFCRKFQENDNVRVALLSITAANAGLNLTAASLVVFAELFWNPGVLVQAEDRAHRIGQLDSVTVHYLVAMGTADDYIWPLVQKKLDVLSQAGLTKDNFSDADTRMVGSREENDELMGLFEEEMCEGEKPAPATCTREDPSQSTLFGHFKPAQKPEPTSTDSGDFIVKTEHPDNSSIKTEIKTESTNNDDIFKELGDQDDFFDTDLEFKTELANQESCNKSDSAVKSNVDVDWGDELDELWDMEGDPSAPWPPPNKKSRIG